MTSKTPRKKKEPEPENDSIESRMSEPLGMDDDGNLNLISEEDGDAVEPTEENE